MRTERVIKLGLKILLPPQAQMPLFAGCISWRAFLHIYVFGRELKQLNDILSLIKLCRRRATLANGEYNSY
jgi:hydrogenase/urease accessory protein HupE